MKRMYLVLIAAVMAVSFSAFVPAGNSNTLLQVTYQDDDLNWHVYTGPLCSGDQIPECIKMTPDGPRQLFYDNDINQPVKRNAP